MASRVNMQETRLFWNAQPVITPTGDNGNALINIFAVIIELIIHRHEYVCTALATNNTLSVHFKIFKFNGDGKSAQTLISKFLMLSDMTL